MKNKKKLKKILEWAHKATNYNDCVQQNLKVRSKDWHTTESTDDCLFEIKILAEKS
tara:strand:- start:27 stop:194 length:168 start_codon:yes stop_codon:yes gene_type:complete